MADQTLSIPSSPGGIVSYKESYKSNLSMSPYVVVFLIVAVVLGRVAIKLILKI